MRDGVRTARDTAAHSRVRSFGCQATRRLGSTCKPLKVDCSSFTPAISASCRRQAEVILDERVVDPQPAARRDQLEDVERR